MSTYFQHYKAIWVQFTQQWYVPSLVVIGLLVLKMQILKSKNVFYHITTGIYSLSLDKGVALHFKNFESLHPQMTFVKFGQNWLMRRWHWKWQPDKVTQGFGSGGWITQFRTALLVYFMMTIWQEWTKADPAPACWARPCLKIFMGAFLEILTS